MTGTAITEANEFMKIYKLPVVQIPTNRPMVRADRNDQVFKTKGGKWAAVAREIDERHEKGQPVLVGTISVEVSEHLGAELARRGIPHVVLNAKPEFAQREGEIVAEAGRPGAVTIATNMAGRGVDIKLGGNPEHLTQLELAKLGLRPGDPDYEERYKDVLPTIEARVEEDREKVLEAGGLFIVGTERHESRRIDNQLRGRSGRQGDPGESRFFLSAEDDLVRLFAGDRIYRILDRLGPVGEEGEEEPIEAKMLSKQIENAQRKVEEQNFLIRKRVLEYDDVMNQQREVVYQYRDRVLEGQDMGETAREQVAEVIERLVEEYTPGDYVEEWDLEGLWAQLDQVFHVDFGVEELDLETIDRDELTSLLVEDALKLYDEREQELGDELMRALERFLLLQIIDQSGASTSTTWTTCARASTCAGSPRSIRSSPTRTRDSALFQDLMNGIWSDFARMVYNVQVEVEGENGDGARHAPAAARRRRGRAQLLRRHPGGPAVRLRRRRRGAAALGRDRVEQRRVDEHEQLGRNDPCWCGSGKKYKKCHGA